MAGHGPGSTTHLFTPNSFKPSASHGIQVMMQTKTQDVARLARAVLAKSSVRELRQLQVDESDETLELSGQVRSFYHKQLAQETVRTVAGGWQMVNRVEVSS